MMMDGKISIGNVSSCGNYKDGYISITVEDSLSSIGFLEIRMDITDFARALMGLGHLPVKYELRGVENLGKKFEVKDIPVAVAMRPGTCHLEDKDIDAAVKNHEVDGWMGRRDDCRNHHNSIGTSKDFDGGFQVYRVHFWRYVDKVTEEEQTDE